MHAGIWKKNECAQFKSSWNGTFLHLKGGVEDTLKTGDYGELSERVPTQAGWGHREEPHGLIKPLRMDNFVADGTHTATDAQFLGQFF